VLRPSDQGVRQSNGVWTLWRRSVATLPRRDRLWLISVAVDGRNQLELRRTDQPGTSKSSRQIAKTLGMSGRSVRRIAKMDLELSAFRRMPAVLSDDVKLKRLERCRALLRRLTVNKVKQVFFTDEKNYYLNPPVSKSVSNFINFHSSWKFCLHLRCCNRDFHACRVAKSHFQVQTALTFFSVRIF